MSRADVDDQPHNFKPVPPEWDWCDLAIEIAIEHTRWARGAGLSAGEVGQSIGACYVENWDQAMWAIAREWRAMVL